jgi:Suppressor of fused protein (SUFU)
MGGSLQKASRVATMPRMTEAPDLTSALRAHVERLLGKVDDVLADEQPGEPRLEILHVRPELARPYHTLVTAGMSSRAMQVPANIDAPRYLELMITLPEQWRVGDHADKWHWPIRQLQTLARLPHASGSWLGWGHTVPNGEPPQPLARSTKLCGAIIAPSLLVPRHFYELTVGTRDITIFAVIPLYREEMEVKTRDGMEALLTQLVEHDVNDLIDPRRRNVTKKFFGLW